MGDTGSLVIGLILSILAIKLINDGIEIPNDKTYKNKGPFIVMQSYRCHCMIHLEYSV